MDEIITKKKPWKDQREGFQQALVYMQGRQLGTIKSLKTSLPKLNDALTDGLEPHTTIVIGGRPGSYKTGLKDQIIRELYPLNPDQKFRVLDFQFEMMAKISAIREFSSIIGKSYKHLCSAEGILSQEDINIAYEYSKTRVKYPIDIVEEPCTVLEFKQYIIQYMEEHSYMEEGVKKYIHTIIGLDHSLLLKKAAFEKDKFEMLHNLGECLTWLKRRYPITFIILSQLNRSSDSPERNEDGKYGNYIMDSDIYGSDALLQHADILIGLNRPGVKKIKFYGPDRYIIDDETIFVMHILKSRNGDTRMSFFKAQFDKMKLIEISTPPMAERRVKT